MKARRDGDPIPVFSRIEIGRVRMKHHTAFLRFEAVLDYCERRCSDKTLEGAIRFGRQRNWFDSRNSLTTSGEVLAEIIMQSPDFMSDPGGTN
jgi:hypothetical protein